MRGQKVLADRLEKSFEPLLASREVLTRPVDHRVEDSRYIQGVAARERRIAKAYLRKRVNEVRISLGLPTVEEQAIIDIRNAFIKAGKAVAEMAAGFEEFGKKVGGV